MPVRPGAGGPSPLLPLAYLAGAAAAFVFQWQNAGTAFSQVLPTSAAGSVPIVNPKPNWTSCGLTAKQSQKSESRNCSTFSMWP